DVAGFGDVVALGDDAQRVDVAAAGGGDVEATACSDRGGDGDGGVDGVRLPSVLGCGVAESDVLVHVVGGEGHVAVSTLVGHGDRAVGTDGADRPGVAV